MRRQLQILSFIIYINSLLALNFTTAQVEISSGGPVTNYSKLNDAFSEINNGTFTGAILIEIAIGISPETGPCVLNSSGAGPANYTSVLIRPKNNNAIIIGNTNNGHGSIELNGSDNVTIDGDNPYTPGINRNLTILIDEINTRTYTSVVRIALSSLISTANNITVKNCILTGNATGRNIASATSTTGSENTTYGILVGGGASTSSVTGSPSAITSVNTTVGSGITAKSFIADNNQISACARGIAVQGSVITFANKLSILNNIIGDQSSANTTTVYSRGLTLQGFDSASVKGNTIQNIQSYLNTAIMGIGLGDVTPFGNNIVIEKNIINNIYNQNNGTSGSYGINLTAGSNNAIINNSITNIHQVMGGSGFSTTSGAFGIRVALGSNNKVYQNSVSLYGTYIGSPPNNLLSAAFAITVTTVTGCDVRSNIFSNTIKGGTASVAHVSIYLPSGGTSLMMLQLNNNAYYNKADSGRGLAQAGTVPGMGFYTTANFNPGTITPSSNLRFYTSSLSAAGTNDNSSFASVSPASFLSMTDLHIPAGTGPTQLESGGAFVGVTTDIDNQTRPGPPGSIFGWGYTPDIGYDEFDGYQIEATVCDSSLVDNGSFQSPWAIGYGSPVWVSALGCEDPGYTQLSGNRKTGSAIVQTLFTPLVAGRVYELSLCARLNSSSVTNYAKIRAVAFNGALPLSGSHPPPSANIAVIDISGKINCSTWSTYTFMRWKANKNFSNIAFNCENNFGSSWIPIGTQLSTVEIDNICIKEVNDSIPCYIADFDSLGNVVPPPGDFDPLCPAMEDTLDMYLGKISDLYPDCGTDNDMWYQNCPDSCSSIGGELPESLNKFLTDDSISEILSDFGFDSVNAFYNSMQKVEDSLVSYSSNMNILDTLFNLGALPDPCDTIISKGPPPDPSGVSPFGGRDIVYVHGFRTTPIIDKISGLDSSETRWPADRSEFYDMDGYWKRGANNYWRNQIERELHTNPEGGHTGGAVYQNRFLIVSHSSTQLGIVGVHAILEQIIKTMNGTNNAGIINCGIARPGEKFGQNGFVIISHSAGSLLSNVALSLSGYVNKIPGLKGKLGNIADVADKCDVHIAIQGAFKGSADPVIALGLVAGFSNLASLSSAMLDIFGIEFLPNGLGWLLHSQLLDLAIPNFIYNGEMFSKLCPTPHSSFNPFCLLANLHLIEDVPMEVVTVAGGNSSDYGASGAIWPVQVIVKQLLQRGFDDGVLSMDCQCGNKITRPYFPNRFLPLPGILTIGLLSPPSSLPKEIAGLFNERLYDMGIHRRLDNQSDRAIGYYLDQKLDIYTSIYIRKLFISLGVIQTSDPRTSLPSILSSYMHASSSCIPSLSPTGMVQSEFEPFIPPLPADISYNPLNRMDHHHSFIQSTSEHYTGVTNEYNSWPNYKPSHGITNSEEVRAMESSYLYNNNLLSQTVKTLPVRYLRGKKIGPWRIPFTKKYIGPFYIWKRYYDLLPGIQESGLGGCGSESYSADCEKTHQLDYIYKYVLAP